MNILIIAWLFPILFMLHDFEEIILVKSWRKRYQRELSSSPMKKKPFDHFQDTASFSIGVLSIFFILSFVTLLSTIFNHYDVWYGLVFAIAGHFAVAHMRQAVQFHHYTPGVFTSILFFPIFIWLLYTAAATLAYSAVRITISCAIGIALSILIFYFLTGIEGKLSRALSHYATR